MKTKVQTARPLVLISHLYEKHHVDNLEKQFPQIRFLHLPKAAPWPEEVKEAEVLLFAGLQKPELSGLLKAAGGIRWLHTGSAGFDWVRVPEVEEQGITVTRSAEVMSIPMAEFALAAMLAHAKNLFTLRDAQERRAWEPPLHSELRGRNLLIVGAGAIGRHIAEPARAFGMKITGIKRTPEPVEGFDEIHAPDRLDALLPHADYVVLTMPLTPETENMIDARRLALMPEHAYLINLARGGLIVEEDFIDAMNRGVIAGATLDAYTVEPLPEDSPLWALPNVLISPHASYRTPEIRTRVFTEFAENLERWLQQEPLANTMREPALGY